MEKEIQNVGFKKATTKDFIPPKILKIRCNTSLETLHNLFSECLRIGNFPDNLKIVDITPIFKKKDPLNKDLFKKKDPINKENYRPISVLPSISKIFEKNCKNK